MATGFEVNGIKKEGFWRDGPSAGDYYRFPNSYSADNRPITRTQNPIVTGTSVLGLVFDGGVVIAADTLGSYGSLARFRNCERVVKVNDSVILGVGGDYADFQFLRDVIEDKVIEDECADDGFGLKPKSLYSWLTRVLYNRRSKFDPLWNTYVIGGLQNGEPFLGLVDKIGTAFEAKQVATGYGMYIAMPMLRDAAEKNPRMTEDEAKKTLTDCLRVLFYRDARAFNRFLIGVVKKDGTKIEGPFELETDWLHGLKSGGF
ncbi:hypothetical protein CHUAL_010466 [Chamberlinius hualienensis]